MADDEVDAAFKSALAGKAAESLPPMNAQAMNQTIAVIHSTVDELNAMVKAQFPNGSVHSTQAVASPDGRAKTVIFATIPGRSNSEAHIEVYGENWRCAQFEPKLTPSSDFKRRLSGFIVSQIPSL